MSNDNTDDFMKEQNKIELHVDLVLKIYLALKKPNNMNSKKTVKKEIEW